MISVIVPVYNTEKYLKRCLDSLLGQTYDDFEIIAVDDGSLDGSLTVLEEYAEKDQRIKVISQENAGASAARNAGLDAARGDCITFADSDDWAEPELLETLLNLMVENEADISCCQYSGYKQGRLPALSVWDNAQALEKFIIHRDLGGTLYTKLFTKSLVQSLHLDSDIRYGEDALFTWEALKKAGCVAVCDKVLYCYDRREDSASGGQFNPIRLDCIKVWGKIADDAGVISPELEKLAHEQLGNMCLHEWYCMVYTGYKDSDCENALLGVVRYEIRAIRQADWLGRGTRLFAQMVLVSRPLVKYVIAMRRNARNATLPLAK